MLCCLCLLENPHLMGIFDDRGEKLNIVEIVNEHFWFKPDQHDVLASQICTACWNKIDDFHKFYKHVEKAHEEFQQNKVYVKKEDILSLSTIKEEIFCDENDFENNLGQLEMEILDNINECRKSEVNPLWDGPNRSDCNNESDFEIDTSDDGECNETIKHDSHNDEVSINLENKTKKRKASIKSEKNKDFLEKKRKLRYSEDVIKKHIKMICDMCDFVGNTFCDIKKHFKEHHSDKKPYVICCSKKIYKNYEIANHAARHENSDCYSLQTHNIECHGSEEKKRHSCELCQLKFGRKNLLEMHRQSHIPKEQWNFICPKCSTRTFKFATQYLLNIHLSMFHNRKINICHVCFKEIKDKKAFEKHVRLHFEDSGPRIKCPIDTSQSWLDDEDNVTNKFENEQDDFEFDIECDLSDGDEPSEMNENYELCLDEELLIEVKSDNSINNFEDQEITKGTNTKKKLNSTKKTRASHRLDPKVSDETIKKHINMTCALCVFVGKSFQELKDHFKAHHPNEKAYVICCNRKFDRLYVIAQHAARHENPDCFRCNECNKSFTTPYGLRTHNIEHHAPDEEKMHACEYCPRKFQRKNLLEHHRSTHIPKEQWTFNCNKCITRTSIFASQYLLNIHNSMFHRKEGNICHVCAKVIKDKKAFEKHVRYHSEDSGPRLKCPLPDCNKWLKDEDNLKTHIQLHNLAGKTYKCPECDKECPNRRALSGHIRFVHSKDIFRCEACDKTFKKALGLKEHMAQHTGESLYKCPFCDRTFNSNANMHSHKKKKHPIEWEQLRRKKIGPVPS